MSGTTLQRCQEPFPGIFRPPKGGRVFFNGVNYGLREWCREWCQEPFPDTIPPPKEDGFLKKEQAMGLRGRTNFTEETIFFVTTTVVDYMNIFTDQKACQILINNIKHYQQKHRFTILAYAIMPSHFHWVIIVDPKYGTLSDIMRDIKKYSAWDIMEYISKEYPEMKSDFKVSGGEYPAKQKRKFWMDRFDDEVIRNEKMFFRVLGYIHNNPVKACLAENPEDYIFSSARNYLGKGNTPLEVDLSYAGIQML